jgi:hypothetical protein
MIFEDMNHYGPFSVNRILLTLPGSLCNIWINNIMIRLGQEGSALQ